MNLHRLRRMPLGEIVCRSRQGAAKWLDRTSASWADRRFNGRVSAAARTPHIDPRQFFSGAAGPVPSTRAAAEKIPGGCRDVIAEADAACRGAFDLLGYFQLSFGDPIDWHLDPVSGIHAPNVHWSRLDPLDSASVGDAKVIWELNRHQWFVRLGQAYRLTGNERYAEVFARHFRHWRDANTRGLGLNWASSLEVAFRLISWSWSLHLFHGSGALTPKLRQAMFEGICEHATHIERYLSYYFSPNTHLTGEALGLYYAGVMVRSIPQSRSWRDLGARILIEQCERQILSDGVYFEQATLYQRYTLEIYLHLLILAHLNGYRLPRVVTERVHKMLDFLLTIRRPDGSMPMVGDGDSGSLLPLVRRAQDDFRGVFAVAAAWFGRADCAWAAGQATPELFWLLGPAGVDRYARLDPAPPVLPQSRCFSEGGYVVMQRGWGPRRHQLTFDVGPLGCPVSAGHGHADLLSVQCVAFGEPYLVDAGTHVYTTDRVSRDFFRSTQAHSTVVVDGQSQAQSTGPFRWSERPRAMLRQWRAVPDIDYADASHAAYRCGIVHRRRVAFVRSHYWVLVDDIDGSGQHTIEVRFQFAPLDVQLEPNSWARARGGAGHALLLRPFSASPLSACVWKGAFGPMQGWASDEYGRRRPAPVLVYEVAAQLPCRVVTLLVPVEDAAARPPDVSPMVDETEQPGGFSIMFEDGERVRVDDGDVQVIKPGVFTAPAGGILQPVSR